MTKIINMLTNVKTAELSLVRRGANNKRFALTKSKDETMKIAPLLATVLATVAEGEAELVTTLKAAGADEGAVEVAVANFRLQTGFKDQISKDEFAAVAKAAGFEVAKASKAEEDDTAEDPKKPGFMMNGKKMAPAKKSHVPADMPEEMRKAFEEQSATLERLEKEAKDKDARIEKIEKEAVLKEYVAKCATEFSHVPGMSAADMGDMLQKAYEVSEDFGKKLEKQWGDTSVAIKKSSLLNVQGASHATHDGASAWGKVEAIAKEYVEKDATLSMSKALDMAMQKNPELYNEYLNENPAQRGQR